MTAPTPNAELAYRVTFSRIGRNHNAPALLTRADGPDHLADLILRHARPHLASRDISVAFEDDMLSGWIFAGVHTGGTFQIERVTPDAHRCPNCAPGYDCERGIYTPTGGAR